MRVGILDLLTTPAATLADRAYGLVLTKQYASIMPQAIAVWCRRYGHRTAYAAYWGHGDPRRLLPNDLDVVFIATYTQASGLAYALARLYRRDGVRTIVGGPHARSFPTDCLRFFDVVVQECDEDLVGQLVRSEHDRGVVVSSKPPRELPTVAERMPEIRASAFLLGRPYASTTIPLLASTGCPYACDFCIDWDTPYVQLPSERLAVDLATVAREIPGAMVSFHDPNFAVRFDDVLDVLAAAPPERRPAYIMEASLAVLRPERLPRLAATNCAMAAPGVESWTSYGSKSGAPRSSGARKVERLAAHFSDLHEHVPYVQANFMFGLDDDIGRDPVRLTLDFMRRTPFVWPVVNLPHPFGGTPYADRLRAEGRVLTTLPFHFYYSPYLAIVPRHYDPIAYYDHLIEMFAYFTSTSMLLRRLRTARSRFVALAHLVRTRVKRRRLDAFRRLRERLRSDPALRAFHEGKASDVPAFYHREYERQLGPFAELVPPEERLPLQDGVPDRKAHGPAHARHGDCRT